MQTLWHVDALTRKARQMAGESTERYADLVAWLKESGYTEPDIALIIGQVEQYEQRMGLDSVMDSLADGNFDLNAIIEEALKKSGAASDRPSLE